MFELRSRRLPVPLRSPVTGITGPVGQHLIPRVKASDIGKIVGIDRDLSTPLWEKNSSTLKPIKPIATCRL